MKTKTFFRSHTITTVMIEHTFIILQGIGNATERKLWQEGVLTWEDFISRRRIERISSEKKQDYDQHLIRASKNLEDENPYYFFQCLHSKEHWRLYEKWKDKACFLDIETTGLRHGLTVIGIYSREGYKYYVRGIDLESEKIEEELKKYKILVTFYGRAFDMPFIKRELDVSVNVPHVDLYCAGRSLGLKGGLKKVEVLMGIEREEDIRGLDGFDAVTLWRKYEKGDDNALDLLIKYNRADTVNLKVLADIFYHKLKERILPFMKGEQSYTGL